MTLDELLNMDESPKLDFKQIWKQDDVNGEYIKDILSLANGNPHHMDEDAYLVFGVSDDKQSIHDISDESLFHPTKYPDLLKLKAYLLTTLNNFSTPNFLGLHLEFIESEDGRVLLITIPPHPYLLSLSKDLKVKKRTDRKGTVYYRVGESISIASPEVIEAFRQQRKKQESTTIINNDNTKVAMQDSTNHGTQTFNF